MARILIIDDEESIRFGFKAHLSKESHEVFTAGDYVSSLDILSTTDPDLIISDIILENNTGIDILEEVKSKGMHCPVIMITGEPNINTATDAVRMGAFDYLPKPIKKETLLRVSGLALQHKALLDEKDKIEKEKERYRNNLEAIFRSLDDAIITVDHEMKVIEANDVTNIICDFPPNDIIGRTFSNDTNQCVKSCHKVLQETLKTKKPIKEFRVKCTHKSRPGQIVLLTSSPLTDKHDKFMGAVLVVKDITRITNLEMELKEKHQFHQIIGKSKDMQELYKLLENLSDTETTVLITGESGTGKEMVAKALHFSGVRSDKPLVTVNCSSLSENLLESELFGHVKGAFTGAVKDKTGRFQMANKGTIFLDEIGDIAPTVQLKLLRILQERKFERVGESNTTNADVRVIAATNCNLIERVRLGLFRQDLYYRLKVIEVALPPLRERREDIPLLASHFLNLFKKRFKRDIEKISDEAMDIFMQYTWPGNIRELEHAMEHAFVLCHDRSIETSHLPPETIENSFAESLLSENKPQDDSQKIIQVLNKAGWNKAKAARMIGLSRQGIYRKIAKYNIQTPAEYNSS